MDFLLFVPCTNGFISDNIGKRQIIDRKIQNFSAFFLIGNSLCNGGHSSWLDRPFSLDEVEKAAFQIGGTKASGPDGFLGFTTYCRKSISRTSF